MHLAPEKRTYRAIVIENGLLRVTVLPELGGRIRQIEDLQTGCMYLHDNTVFRPVRIPPCYAFLSSGIELNFPTTHSPTGMEPVGFEFVEKPNGGAGVAVGERELRWGLVWRAEVLLFPNFRGVCVSVKAWNPTSEARKVQWWSNAAQPAEGDTEFVFPEEPVVTHIIGERDGHWPRVHDCDRRWYKNYDGMCGLFWEPTQADYFGIYHHERDWGLLHLAKPEELPGKKLWAFGYTGKTENWTLAMTRGSSRSCEIQSGIPTLQKTFFDLQPDGEMSFSEFWIPIDSRSDLDAPRRPTYAALIARLGGKAAVEAARGELDSPTGTFWRELLGAYRRKDVEWLETHKGEVEELWPPTGLSLEEVLKWAAESAGGVWRYPLALWFCARENWDDALPNLEAVVLEFPQLVKARAMLALLLWRAFHRPDQAWSHLRSALQELRDGQLFVHANALLRELGLLKERQEILKTWPEDDFRKVETEAEIALDSGAAEKAIDILLRQDWERQHKRNRRGEIWKAARKQLGLSDESVPSCLGEDPAEVDE